MLRQHSVGKLNENGLRLLSHGSEYWLVIINTLFQLKNKFKTSWQHLRCKHWHIIVRKADRKEVRVTRAMPGADCWTDHRLIRAKLTLELRPPLRKTPPCRKLNCDALTSPHSANQLREQIALQLSKLPETPADPDVSSTWSNLRTAIYQAAVESVGDTKTGSTVHQVSTTTSGKTQGPCSSPLQPLIHLAKGPLQQHPG